MRTADIREAGKAARAITNLKSEGPEHTLWPFFFCPKNAIRHGGAATEKVRKIEHPKTQPFAQFAKGWGRKLADLKFGHYTEEEFAQNPRQKVV